MLSPEEIRGWAAALEAESTLKLVNLGHKRAESSGRDIPQIVFRDDGNEYRVWIFRELNIIYLDVLREGLEAETKLYRGPVTRRSLESISRILRRLQP